MGLGKVVKADGRIRVAQRFYSIRQDLAGHHVMVHLNATTRSFDVFRGDHFLQSVPIKGLQGQRLPWETSIDLMREQARAEERQRWQKLRQARLQA